MVADVASADLRLKDLASLASTSVHHGVGKQSVVFLGLKKDRHAPFFVGLVGLAVLIIRYAYLCQRQDASSQVMG